MEANTKCSILTTLNFGHLHVHVHTQHVLTDEHVATCTFVYVHVHDSQTDLACQPKAAAKGTYAHDRYW